ncbi:Hypothetical_protein [Hexamita inflata]|uniref:Hypothetical_protein n=1 Tax=Hexamita inflata TaxID=28002 RepID=A0AA86PKG9_9EUKA|nr:Hypothetical protein HINF_LOCUS27778 [Hexamita inflata]
MCYNRRRGVSVICGSQNQETSLPRIETDILVLYPYKLDSSTSTLCIAVQILTQPKFVTVYKSLQTLNFVITIIKTDQIRFRKFSSVDLDWSLQLLEPTTNLKQCIPKVSVQVSIPAFYFIFQLR